jgi:hypothetical protein
VEIGPRKVSLTGEFGGRKSETAVILSLRGNPKRLLLRTLTLIPVLFVILPFR